MTPTYHIDWLLDCEPRPAQIEALCRSYDGYRWRNSKYEEVGDPTALPHAGKSAAGWCHFMEMRVGKTPTALNEYMLFKRDHGVNKLLVFSPNKYKYTWGLEMGRFGVDVPVEVFESSTRDAHAKFLKGHQTSDAALVLNYEALVQSNTVDILQGWVDKKTMIVADESALIKNKDSIISSVALTLSQQAGVTRPLSGLPAPQGPHDLWHQLRFAKKINGFNFHAFKATFCKIGGFKGKRVLGTKNEDELNKLLDDTTFRGRRADWGTKLDTDYDMASLPMMPEQKRVYMEMDQDFVAWINENEFVSAEQVITKRMKLQQISSGFVYNEHRQAVELIPFDKTPKFVDLIERLRSEISGKVIVVGHYVYTIRKLIENFKEFSPAVIAGNDLMKELRVSTDSEKARFNGDPSCRVIVCQGLAAKYGNTLMGNEIDPCLTTVFFENSYSLDTRSQMEERNQGEGQKAGIYCLDYYSSPIEKEIIGALQEKRSVSDAIMDFYHVEGRGSPVSV